MIKCTAAKRLIPIYGNEGLAWGDVFIHDWQDWDEWLAEFLILPQPIFILSQPVLSAGNVTVYANGVMLQEGTDYTVNDGVIVLDSPVEDVSIVCDYQENGIATMNAQIAI